MARTKTKPGRKQNPRWQEVTQHTRPGTSLLLPEMAAALGVSLATLHNYVRPGAKRTPLPPGWQARQAGRIWILTRIAD